MDTLSGHTSPETAYVVADYPYGFRLRCQMRHWIEYKRGHGFRHVTQTSNPKRPGLVWNKPKAGTYCPVLVLTLDDAGHVGSHGLGTWATEEQITAFEAAHAGALTPEHRAALATLRAMNARLAHVTYRVEAAGYATIDANGLTVHASQADADAHRAA
jgi:hypothetical protein